MVDADVHPAGVRADVVDPIRDGLLDVRPGEEEAVVLNLDRVALRSPLPAWAGEPTQLLTFLGIDADHWLACGLMLLDLLVDIAELRVPPWVLLAFQGLGLALQAESVLTQQPPDRGWRYPMPPPGQLLRQYTCFAFTAHLLQAGIDASIGTVGSGGGRAL